VERESTHATSRSRREDLRVSVLFVVAGCALLLRGPCDAAGGLEPLLTLSIITAFPLIFALILATLSFQKWLIQDRTGAAFAESKSTHPLTGGGRESSYRK
jgi:choline-glycine betaine transporter